MLIERRYIIATEFCNAEIYTDSKRKATDQPESLSPSKRVKNSHSQTVTPEPDGKPRVVPFPEKVNGIEDHGCCWITTDEESSLQSQRSAMAKSNSES